MKAITITQDYFRGRRTRKYERLCADAQNDRQSLVQLITEEYYETMMINQMK